LAGTMTLLACGTKKNTQADIQAVIDSTVNARVAKHDAENAVKNDSTLKAMEKEKADAISKEQQAQKKPAPPKTIPAVSQASSVTPAAAQQAAAH